MRQRCLRERRGVGFKGLARAVMEKWLALEVMERGLALVVITMKALWLQLIVKSDVRL